MAHVPETLQTKPVQDPTEQANWVMLRKIYEQVARAINYGVVSGGVPTFSDEEVPGGAINGINVTFTLSNAPSPTSSLLLYLNGLLQAQGIGEDYILSGVTITMLVAPIGGSRLIAWYRY